MRSTLLLVLSLTILIMFNVKPNEWHATRHLDGTKTFARGQSTPKIKSPRSIPIRHAGRKKQSTGCVERSRSYWIKVMKKYARNDKEFAWIKRVAMCESGIRACAVNHTNGYYKGIMQWSPYYWNKQY